MTAAPRALFRISLLAGLSGEVSARVARLRVYRLSAGEREQGVARLGPGQTFNAGPPF